MGARDDLFGWTPAVWSGEPAAPTIEWRRLGALRLGDPFFEDTLRKALSDRELGLLRKQTTAEELGEFIEQHPGIGPSGFIFHMSRCGSTLVSQLLAAVPTAVVISEAPPIDAVVQARAADEVRVRHLRWLVGALGQRRLGSERALFVKLDAWHTPHIPLFRRAFPGVPWMFVYREPARVLASHARQRGMHLVPGLVDVGYLGLPPDLFPRVSFEAYGAHVLAAICEAALRAHAEGGGKLLHYAEITTRVGELTDWFKLDLSESDRKAMQAAAGFDSKRPEIPFSPATAERERVPEGLQRLAEEICGDVYRRLEAARSGKMVSTAPVGAPQASPPKAPAPTSSLRLPLLVDLAGLHADLAAIAPSDFVPHFNDGYYEGDWSGVSLRSTQGKMDQLHPDPARRDDHRDTELLARCPHVQSFLAELKCQVRAVRFLRLGPGSSIKEHNDPDLGFDLGEVRLHVVVTSNPGVEMVIGGRVAPMHEGECWYHDFGLPHRVANRGSTARTHLVVDCVLNPWLRDLFASAEAAVRSSAPTVR